MGRGHKYIIISLAAFYSCCTVATDSSEAIVRVFHYPNEVRKLHCEEGFDNSVWLYYCGMNAHGYFCFQKDDNTREKPVSIVQTAPKLEKIIEKNDTIFISLSETLNDSTAICQPNGMWSANGKLYFSNFLFTKNSQTVFLRFTEAPFNIKRMLNETIKKFMVNSKDSVFIASREKFIKLGIYPIDELEKKLIDTIRTNKNNLSPWFYHIAKKRGII